jgi:Spy/CpxP family protein refolding chaperone
VVDRFTKELNLTPQQHDQLARILDETGQQYQALHEQVRQQYNAIRQSGRQRIREILTPEQRTRFEEIVKKLDEERRKDGRRR